MSRKHAVVAALVLLGLFAALGYFVQGAFAQYRPMARDAAYGLGAAGLFALWFRLIFLRWKIRANS